MVASSSSSYGVRAPAAGKPIIVSVEAAIASGKSTLLAKLEEHFGDAVHIIPEPVHLWQAVGGNPENNILQKFYMDPKRWSYSFQSYVFLSRVNAVEEAIEKLRKEGRLERTVIIVERSYNSDKETFGQMLKESGDISQLEWEMYETWWNWLVDKAPKFAGHVYLQTSVDTVMRRLAIRNRGEECGLPREYQERLIEKHELWVKKKQEQNVPICTLNCDKNFKDESSAWVAICGQLTRFFLQRCMPDFPMSPDSHRTRQQPDSELPQPPPARRRLLQRHQTMGALQSDLPESSPCSADVKNGDARSLFPSSPDRPVVQRRRMLRVQMSH